MKFLSYLALLVLCAVQSGCSDGEGPPIPVEAALPTPANCANFVSVFTIRDRMQQPVNSFVTGEPITFELQITNTSQSPQVLTGSDGCPPVEFKVQDASGRTVWGNLVNVACTAVITPLTYASSQTRSFTAKWLQQGTVELYNGHEVASNTVLVKFKSATPSAVLENLMQILDVDEDRGVGGVGWRRWHSRSKGVAQLINHLQSDLNVESVEPDYIAHVLAGGQVPPGLYTARASARTDCRDSLSKSGTFVIQ
jgi:hypothetical protein